MEMVAEGVEDDGVQQASPPWGGDRAQGSHIARPMDHDRFTSWLSSSPHSAAAVGSTAADGRGASRSQVGRVRRGRCAPFCAVVRRGV